VNEAAQNKDLPMSSSAEPFVRDCYFVPVPDKITAHDLPVAGTLPPGSPEVCYDF